jgi:hypothetical protein
MLPELGDSIEELPFFLGTWLDPKVPVVVLVLPEWVASNLLTEPALNPKFDWVVVLVPPRWVALNPPTKLALKPKFDWVVGCKLALKPKFCCPMPTPGGANVTSGFALPMLRPMAAMGVPPGDTAIVLMCVAAVAAMAVIDVLPRDEGTVFTFAATTAVAAIVGGGVGVCNIVVMLGES